MLLFFHSLLVLLFASLVASVAHPHGRITRGVTDPDCNPPKEYGKPLWTDCVNAYLAMHNEAEVAETLLLEQPGAPVNVKFLGLGAHAATTDRTFQTPRFWTFGTCRIAILLNGYPRAVSASSNWGDIASAVDRIQRCPNHSGYMFKGNARPGQPNRTPIGIHVYAANSDFNELVVKTIALWVKNAKGGAQKDPTPLPDPSNVGDVDSDPTISDMGGDEPGPSTKRPRAGPSTYCLPDYDCGDGAICGPVKPSTNSEVIFGKGLNSALEIIGQCILDPFTSDVARRHRKRAFLHIGGTKAPPICNEAIYGRPRRTDCENAAAAMEQDWQVPDVQRWSRPTSYFSSAAAGAQEEETDRWGFLRVPRTYQCGTCIIGINVGNNPLPDNEHDIASKIAVRMAATYVVYRCPGLGAGGPTSRHRAGGLITVGQRQKLWITAFHVPNLPNELAKRRSRGYANDPQVNAYLRTCDWPGGGNVKRTGNSCVAPNGINDALDNEEPDMSDEDFKKLMTEQLHEMAATYGAQYCINDEFCGVGFKCQTVGTAGFGVLMGIGNWGGRAGLCVEEPL